MELEAAKMIGAGLAEIALAGAGVGIWLIFGNYLSGAMRNPSAAQKQFPNLLLGFALAEAQYLNEYPTFFEDDEVIPGGVPQPAVIVTENEGIPEAPAWTSRYLIPTSIAIATIVVLGNIIQYFRKVVKKRYRVVE